MAIAIFYLDVSEETNVENQVKKALTSVAGVNEIQVDTKAHRIEIAYDEEAIGVGTFRRKLTGMGVPIKT